MTPNARANENAPSFLLTFEPRFLQLGSSYFDPRVYPHSELAGLLRKRGPQPQNNNIEKPPEVGVDQLCQVTQEAIYRLLL